MDIKVVFRTDSSLEIGSGHLMRCLTLADQLKRGGAAVSFVCRELPGNLIPLVKAKGYPVSILAYPGDREGEGSSGRHTGSRWEADAEQTIAALGGSRPQWLIVDHYQLAVRWEQKLRPHVRRIMVIDDLADRPHDCDLLLDQNLYDDLERRYDKLVPAGCRKLLGPRYALLREEFVTARGKLREREGEVRRILVFFGGSDPSNETEKALLALRELGRQEIAVDVVLGAVNPHAERIRALCADHGHFRLHIQTASMARLMVEADLFIGSGGTSTWERCFLGLPSLVWTVAQNQMETTRALSRRNLLSYLGWYQEVGVEDVMKGVEAALGDPIGLRAMGVRALNLMDHQADRVGSAMGISAKWQAGMSAR